MIGHILNIHSERGFGFVSSDSSKNYYFKTRDCNYSAIIGDSVAYEISKTPNGNVAQTIRKIYTNKKGIKFIPRINQHHIHLDLDKYLAPIIGTVENSKNDDVFNVEYEFPTPIGKTCCISTNPGDEILFAIRKGWYGHSRFVLNSSPLDCKHVFAVFKKN
jgi:hypothetical protein